MAEFKRLPTQDELSKMLYQMQLGGKSQQDIINENLNTGSTVRAIPDNLFQKMASGAQIAGQQVNKLGTAADVAKMFPGYTGQKQVNIPTGFNFAAKQDPMGGVVPQGLQTQQVNVNQLLQAIKPADVLGLTGAQQAYTDIGMGKAPNPMDVLDVAGLGAVGMGAGKGLLGVAKATKGLPVGMSIKDVSQTSLLSPDASLVKGVAPGEEMFVQHNLTAEKLMKADKLGGMPVPSLAISKSESPLMGFGDITLIAPKEFAASSAKNPVYRADAYTKTKPYTEFKIDPKSEQKLKNVFSDVIDKVPDAEYSFNRTVNEWRDKDRQDLVRAKFLNEKGVLPDAKEFSEPYQFSNEMGYRIREMKPEYDDWLNNFDSSLPSMGVDIKETIFKGYTPSGNRKYSPANLENLVKEMKGGAGSQNWRGVGQLRAVSSPKFKNFSEVKASRENLLSGDKMSEIKQQSEDAYNDLTKRLRELSNYDADDALMEIGETKNLGALDRIYQGKVTPELKSDIYSYINKLKSLPTEYFEVKPQRAVGIEEFAGAIIPVDSPKSVRDILQKRGIQNIYEYSTDQERKELIKKFGKEMFAAAPVSAGLLGSEDDR